MLLYQSKSGLQSWCPFGCPPVFTWGAGVGLLCGRYWPIPVSAAAPGNHWRYAAGQFLNLLAQAVADRHGWAVVRDTNGQYDLIVPAKVAVGPLMEAITAAAAANGCRYYSGDTSAALAAIGHPATCLLDYAGRPVFQLGASDLECYPILYPEQDEDIELPPREGQTEPRLRTQHNLGSDQDGHPIVAVTPRDAEWMGDAIRADVPVEGVA